MDAPSRRPVAISSTEPHVWRSRSGSPMLDALLDSLRKKLWPPPASTAPFDPSRLADPVALRTGWDMLSGRCSYYRTHRLVTDGAHRMRFREAGPRAGYMLAFGMGLVLVVVSPEYLAIGNLEPSALVVPLLFGVPCLVVGVALMVVGGAGLRRGFTSIVFDTGRGEFWKGRVGPAAVQRPDELEAFEPLDRVHAVQLLSEWCEGRESSFHSYELNLVMDDASRRHVVAHARGRRMLEDAERLAAFLGRPLWGATGEEPG